MVMRDRMQRRGMWYHRNTGYLVEDDSDIVLDSEDSGNGLDEEYDFIPDSDDEDRRQQFCSEDDEFVPETELQTGFAVEDESILEIDDEEQDVEVVEEKCSAQIGEE
uniref:Uncharacterized protein n=1 Tax=Leersia perrieri TaxID=77586 RepID=A0A0D9WXC0_9ORYZ